MTSKLPFFWRRLWSDSGCQSEKGSSRQLRATSLIVHVGKLRLQRGNVSLCELIAEPRQDSHGLSPITVSFF